MIRLSSEAGSLCIRADAGDFAPRHESQLGFWGFRVGSEPNTFVSLANTAAQLLPKLVAYFDRAGLAHELSQDLHELIRTRSQIGQRLKDAIVRGQEFKSANLAGLGLRKFARFAKDELARPLKPHQLKAAMHLLSVENGANFSVPGSGKTSVLLAVFHWLRTQGLVDSLFVVGPPSCFGPWRSEYETVIGCEPRYQIVAGGDIDLRHSKYFVNQSSATDLFLTTFQTLQRDEGFVRVLFQEQGLRFLLVIDEAHYIKQIGGAWANAVLEIARFAVRRCVLTGTPFPRSYADGFNLFDVLWPDSPPMSLDNRHRIASLCDQRRWHDAASIVQDAVGSLFYRVRKADLGLAPQVFHPPIMVSMKPQERLLYDLILDRVQALSLSDFSKNQQALSRLRRGRMVRLRQCLSYPALLASAVEDYAEDLMDGSLSVANVIKKYDATERPAKMDALLSLVERLVSRGEKVVVWSNFIRSIERISELMRDSGIGVRLIYGNTPTETTEIDDVLTREKIVAEFTDPQSLVRVLVANPAACAESISLHKACSNAVYYDLSYNCAQYLQSLDRIHRVGGSESQSAHYYFLQYADTIDRDVLLNVQRKASNMARVIEQDCPVYSLDMFEQSDDEEAYERLFGSSV